MHRRMNRCCLKWEHEELLSASARIKTPLSVFRSRHKSFKLDIHTLEGQIGGGAPRNDSVSDEATMSRSGPGEHSPNARNWRGTVQCGELLYIVQ